MVGFSAAKDSRCSTTSASTAVTEAGGCSTEGGNSNTSEERLHTVAVLTKLRLTPGQ